MSKKKQGSKKDEIKIVKIMPETIKPLVLIVRPKEPSPEQEQCMTDRFISFLETQVEEIDMIIDRFSSEEREFEVNTRFAMIHCWLNQFGYDLSFYKGQVLISPLYDLVDPAEALEHDNDDRHE